MSSADNRVPLLLRTVQTLRERFAALRSVGSVEAVREEVPSELRPKREPPEESLPFQAEGETELRWWNGSLVERSEGSLAFRSVWLGCNVSLQRRLLQICREANGFVPFVRAKYGLPEACYTYLDEEQWIWTVFELAEARVPFTVLALGKRGAVFRYSETGQCWAAESHIEAGRDARYSANQFLQHIGGLEYGPSRYWHLHDLIEASIAVMDMIEVAIPSLENEPEEVRRADEEKPVAGGGEIALEDTTKAGGRKRGPNRRLMYGLTLDESLETMAAIDPARKRWSAAQWKTIVDWEERSIEGCETYKRFRREAAAELAAEAKRAEDELAARYAEDDDGHGGFRVSSTKSGIGRQKGETPKQRKLRQKADRLLAKDKRPKKPPE